MATTFVFPTPVADPTAHPTLLPAAVADPTASGTNLKLPAIVLGAALTAFVMPTPLMGSVTFSYTPTGGMLMGGQATVVGMPYIPTGGMKMGGSAPSSLNTAIAPTGGMQMGGAATVNFVIVNVYDMAADGVPQGGMTMGGAALVADKIDYIPTGGMQMGGTAIVLEHIPFTPTGGMLMSGAAGVQEITNFTPTGGMLMSGAAVVKEVTNITPSGGMSMGGSATVKDYQAFFQPSGGMQMGGAALAYMVPSHLVVTTENPYADPFPGWAVNYETHAPSRYMGLPANSLTRFHGRAFVANAGGIYELGADDDAGQPINASIELATTNYGTNFEKRMEKAYVSLRSPGKMRLKVKVKGKVPQYYVLVPTISNDDDVRGTRIPIGKGLVGDYWGVRLDNLDGADFEIDSAEFNPVRGTRHGA